MLEFQQTSPATQMQGSNSRVKAAIIVRLMRSIGTDLSLSELPQDSQVLLARAIGEMGPVDREMVNSTIEEFTNAVDAMALPAPNGMYAALEALDGQISPDVASKMAEEAARKNPEHAWVRLARLDDEELASILELESTEIAALLLSKLPVVQAARVLTKMPGERARKLACTTPQIDKMSVQAVLRIGQALADDHCKDLETAFNDDAVSRVSAMLNSTESKRREEVLGGLDEDDPDFAKRVRRSIFTFANIPQRIDPLDIPKVIRSLSQEQLQTVIAGGMNGPDLDRAAAEFILNNMSKRMAGQIRDEIAEATFSAKAAEVDELHSLLITTIKDAAETGDITLIEEEEDEQEENNAA